MDEIETDAHSPQPTLAVFRGFAHSATTIASRSLPQLVKYNIEEASVQPWLPVKRFHSGPLSLQHAQPTMQE